MFEQIVYLSLIMDVMAVNWRARDENMNIFVSYHKLQ